LSNRHSGKEPEIKKSITKTEPSKNVKKKSQGKVTNSSDQLTFKTKGTCISEPNSNSQLSILMQKMRLPRKKKASAPQIRSKTEESNRIQTRIRDENQIQRTKEEQFLRKRMEILQLNRLAKQSEQEKWDRKKLSELTQSKLEQNETFEV
jgi:hypothetical protein